MDTTNPLSAGGAGAPGALKRNTVLAAGGAALVALGLAAGLTLRSAPSAPAPEPAVAPVAQMAPQGAVAAPAAAPVVSSTMLANDGAPPPQPVVQAQAQAAQPAPAAAPAVPAPAHHRAVRASTEPSHAVAVCAECGTVEAVNAVKVKGQGSGVGAVAGGVVGGALANQFGHGNGKAALTVLGAVGGAFGGNEVEKHVRAVTVYDVTVRMQDGSLRSIRQQSAPAVGERVVVDGNTLRPDQRGG